MKKETIKMKISVHYIQARLMKKIESGDIDFGKDTLRAMGEKIGVKKVYPEQIKHHLEQLVKLGALQKIRGQYKYIK